MSLILKRKVLVDTTDGYHRFYDWAMVTTALGTMAEPFMSIGARIADSKIEDFDWSDDMQRIDAIQNCSLDKAKLMVSGGEVNLTGGDLMPRAGR